MSLNIENQMEEGPQGPISKDGPTKAMKLTLLLINCLMLALGNTGGPLLLRLYFLRGGHRRWLSSWLETGGWPVVLIPLCISYLNRRKAAGGNNTKVFLITPFLFGASAFLGLLTGLDDYMYAYGSSYLPVSTSSLLISTQLVFTAVFAVLVVKQRFNPYSINSIFLLTLGAVVLGLHTKGDRPAGETRVQYYLGFLLTLGAAALYGLVLPLTELTYKKARQAITYTLVLEMQMVMCFFATAFCTVGMLANNDFKVIGREAKEFELGEEKYYIVLVASALFWQLFFLGIVGVISASSSLHAAVLVAALIPVTEVMAVFFFKEKFSTEKGLSLVLSLWGFASYFYGEWMKLKKEMGEKKKKTEETQKPVLETDLDIRTYT